MYETERQVMQKLIHAGYRGLSLLSRMVKVDVDPDVARMLILEWEAREGKDAPKTPRRDYFVLKRVTHPHTGMWAHAVNAGIDKPGLDGFETLDEATAFMEARTDPGEFGVFRYERGLEVQQHVSISTERKGY